MNNKQAKALRKQVKMWLDTTTKGEKSYNLTNMGLIKMLETDKIGVDGSPILFPFQPQVLTHKPDTFTHLYKRAKRQYKRGKGHI